MASVSGMTVTLRFLRSDPAATSIVFRSAARSAGRMRGRARKEFESAQRCVLAASTRSISSSSWSRGSTAGPSVRFQVVPRGGGGGGGGGLGAGSASRASVRSCQSSPWFFSRRPIAADALARSPALSDDCSRSSGASFALSRSAALASPCRSWPHRSERNFVVGIIAARRGAPGRSEGFRCGSARRTRGSW